MSEALVIDPSNEQTIARIEIPNVAAVAAVAEPADDLAAAMNYSKALRSAPSGGPTR